MSKKTLTEKEANEILANYDIPPISPTGWRYLIEVDVPKSGQIILAETSERMLKNNSTVARILKAGPLVNCNHGEGMPWAKPGDRVHLLVHAGTTVRTRSGSDKAPIKYINDDDILGLIGE